MTKSSKNKIPVLLIVILSVTFIIQLLFNIVSIVAIQIASNQVGNGAELFSMSYYKAMLNLFFFLLIAISIVFSLLKAKRFYIVGIVYFLLSNLQLLILQLGYLILKMVGANPVELVVSFITVILLSSLFLFPSTKKFIFEGQK